jgi:diguanylate cyclase (GGDEF)-like protein
VADEITELLSLSRALACCTGLEDVLQTIATRTAGILGTPRVSIRLFDPSHTRLLATCRAGAPLHRNGASEYRPGEGLIGWVAQQVKPLRSDDAEADPRFVSRPDMTEAMGSFLGAPVVSEGACIGVISVVAHGKAAFGAHAEDLLQLIASMCAPHVEVVRLSRLAQLDPLTGTFNRHGLDLICPATEVRPLSLVMVDIDHFKRINDQHGHAAGDEVLKRVARLLSDAMRGEDSVVRMGGEEFLLVLPDLDVHTAARIAERTRGLVEQAVVMIAHAEVRLTVSAGVAQRLGGEARDETVARADEALYRAKSSGRNRVVVAEAPQ